MSLKNLKQVHSVLNTITEETEKGNIIWGKEFTQLVEVPIKGKSKDFFKEVYIANNNGCVFNVELFIDMLGYCEVDTLSKVEIQKQDQTQTLPVFVLGKTAMERLITALRCNILRFDENYVPKNDESEKIKEIVDFLFS